MITYQFDPSKPYLVLDANQTHVIVSGSSKVVETSAGQFGGVHGTWKIEKWQLLNRDQKKTIQWLRRKAGHQRADREKEILCAVAIVRHSFP